MKTTNRFALSFSITVIILFWVWTLYNLKGVRTMPEAFSDLVWVIVREKLIVLGVIFLLLKIQHQSFQNLGLTIQNWTKHVSTGLLLGTLMFIIINVVLTSLLNSLIPVHAASGVMEHFKDQSNVIVWLLIGIFAGGLVEEVQRIFVLTRFEEWMGKTGLIIALILTSIIFGIGHLYQGIGSAISTGVGGLCFGLIYLRRRSALEAIVAHAFSDALAIIMATYLVR